MAHSPLLIACLVIWHGIVSLSDKQWFRNSSTWL